MVQITINGKQMEVPEGTTVLRAAEMAGIYIPRLCDHKALTPYGGCRLCIVEVQGVRVPMASCTLPVNNGMVVNTETEALNKSRKFVLSMLFSERNHFCPFCQVSGGDCELQNAAYHEEMTHWPIQPGWNKFPVDTSHPYFVLDNNRCILCRRCVRACAEMAGNFTLSVAERGAKSLVVADTDIPLGESTCIKCGSCVQVCPTGAIIDRTSAYQIHDKDLTEVKSICNGCSVGCSIKVMVRDNRIVRIEGDYDGSVNRGVLCETGRYNIVNETRKRITKPMIKKDGRLEPVTWEEALKAVSTKLAPLASDKDGIAAIADRFDFRQILVVQLIGTGPVDDRAGRADLDAASALDACALAKRDIGICDDHALRAALRHRKSEVTGHLRAGSDTAPAQDAAVVIQDKIGVGSIDREVIPTRLDGPVGHLLFIGSILQFAVAAADLAERAEVIAFAEQHREHELSRFLQRFCLRVDHHAVVDRQCAGCHRHAHALYFDNAQAASAVGS